MKTLSLIIALSFSPLAAMAADSCGTRLQAFNIYEELVDGRIVEKHSIFPVEDWSESSAFEGLLIKDSEDKDVQLSVEVKKTATGKVLRSADFSFAVWPRNRTYRESKQFVPADFFRVAPGVFTLKLIQKKKTLCEDSYRIQREG